MKTIGLLLTLAASLALPVQAQYYQSNTVRDTTLLGAVAGAVIGHNNGRHAAEGALLGAIVGYGVGSLAQAPSCEPSGYTRAEAYPSVTYAPQAQQRVVYVERSCQPAPAVVYVTPARPVYRPSVVVLPVAPRVVISRPYVYYGRDDYRSNTRHQVRYERDERHHDRDNQDRRRDHGQRW